MFKFAPYVLKGLWQHQARTLLTVCGAAVGLFVFCFVASVQEGLGRITQGQQADRRLIVFQENRFCPTTSKLPQDYARTISELPAVKDVIPIQVYTNNCRASLDVVVFNGMPAEKLKSSRNLTITSGDWNTFASQHNAALVGRNVAQRRKLKMGDSFSIGDITVEIAGIFASDIPAEDSLIFTHLEFLQYTRELNRAGIVTEFEVVLDESADPDAVAAAIDTKLRSGPVATVTRRKGAFQASTLADLVDLIGFAHWLGYSCVGLVLTLVATTTIMSVQDRIQEHAVLQTLGLRPSRVFRIVLSESIVTCLIGGISGTFLALTFLGWSGYSIGAEGVMIAFRPSWSLGITGLMISCALGVIAGAVPAWLAARADIVTSLQPT